MDLDAVVKFTSADVRCMNVCFRCMISGRKPSGVTMKGSGTILCFVHPTLLFWNCAWSCRMLLEIFVGNSEVMGSSRCQGVRNERRVVKSAENTGN